MAQAVSETQQQFNLRPSTVSLVESSGEERGHKLMRRLTICLDDETYNDLVSYRNELSRMEVRPYSLGEALRRILKGNIPKRRSQEIRQVLVP